MRLSYKLKVFANKGKIVVLENLAAFWVSRVNYYIDLYWRLPDWEIRFSRPPKEFRGSGLKLEDKASVKAWQMVWTVRKKRGTKRKPVLKTVEFELDESLFTFGDFATKEFDLWLKVYSGKRGKRIAIPVKKHRRLNYWLKRGATLQKTVKFKLINKYWYVIVYLQPPNVGTKEAPVIGIDLDYTNGAVDSAGEIWFDESWVDLRKRTKWRKYPDGNNPLRQAFNRLAKTLVNNYQCHFAFEQLNLQGKRGRSRKFRRDYKNLPYGHLAKRVETLTSLEGFQTVRVNPAWTSQTCPVCNHRDRQNRSGDRFQCKVCGFTAHADIVAATNIAIRAGHQHKLRPVVAQVVAEEWRRRNSKLPVESYVVWTPLQSRPPADLRRCDPPCHSLANRLSLDRYG